MKKKYRGNYFKTLVIACVLIAFNFLSGCESVFETFGLYMCATCIGATGLLDPPEPEELIGYEYGDFVLEPLDDGTYRVISISEQGNQKDALVIERNYMGVEISYLYDHDVHHGCLSAIYLNFSNTPNAKPELGKQVVVREGEFECNVKKIFFKDLVHISGPGDALDDVTFFYLFDVSNQTYRLPEEQKYIDKVYYEYFPIIEGYDYALGENEELYNVRFHDSALAYDIANVLYYQNYPTNIFDPKKPWTTNGYYWMDNIEKDTQITFIPEDPTRDGYTFEGWYTEPECINKWDFSSPVTHETKVTEKLTQVDITIRWKLYDEIYYRTATTETTVKIEETIPFRLYAKWVETV